MTESIVLRLETRSEQKFFEIFSTSFEINLKELCKKIPRKQVYQILKRLEEIKKAFELPLFIRKAGLCQITGLPIIKFEVQNTFKVVEAGKERYVKIG